MLKKLRKKSVFRGNKPRFYKKARRWYSTGGRIKAEGFRRIKMVNYKDYIILTTSKGKVRVQKQEAKDSANIMLEKPLFAFEAENGKILLVTKGGFRAGSGEKIAINAYVVEPLADAHILRTLATAKASISKKHKIAYFSDFGWLTDTKANTKISLAPEWLRGKGFGLFLDSLRQIELAKKGVRKWFASIVNAPQSRQFAQLRGFRKPTKKEAELFVDCVFGKQQDKETWVKIIQEGYMVKDLVPIKRRQKK